MAYFGPNPQTIQSGSLDSLRNLSDLSNTALARTNLSVPSQADFNKALTTDPEAFTEAQKGQALANIGAGVLAGLRNKFINGDFDVWQRAISQSAQGFRSADRYNIFGGGTWSFQRVLTAAGAFLNSPKYNAFLNVTAAAPGGSNPTVQQRIEDVRQFNSKKVTVRGWFYPLQNINIEVAPFLVYGTNGSPVDTVTPKSQALTANTWNEIKLTFDLPSITGKTINEVDSSLQIQFRFPTGAIYGVYMTHFSLVEGDATAELDPFSPRHIDQEIAMCRRYARISSGTGRASGASTMEFAVPLDPPMRVAPSVSLMPGAGAWQFGRTSFSISNVGTFHSEAGFVGITVVSADTGLTPGAFAATVGPDILLDAEL